MTDRDLTLQALTGQDDPRQTPIHKYMSSKVVTGESTWNLTQVSSVMAEHQIRRLPIVQDGKLVGIISLGDVARYEDQNHVVAQSLQAISEPLGVSLSSRQARGGVLAALAALAMAAVATTAFAWLTWNHSGQALRKQISDSEAYHAALDAFSTARDKVDEAASSKQVRDFRHDVGVKVNDLATSRQVRDFRHDVSARVNDLAARTADRGIQTGQTQARLVCLTLRRTRLDDRQRKESKEIEMTTTTQPKPIPDTRYAMQGAPQGDFASGTRALPPVPEIDDFASGEAYTADRGTGRQGFRRR